MDVDAWKVVTNPTGYKYSDSEYLLFSNKEDAISKARGTIQALTTNNDILFIKYLPKIKEAASQDTYFNISTGRFNKTAQASLVDENLHIVAKLEDKTVFEAFQQYLGESQSDAKVPRVAPPQPKGFFSSLFSSTPSSTSSSTSQPVETGWVPITTKQKKPEKKLVIPKDIRSEVWRKHAGDVMTTECFSCEKTLRHEDYQCGHILSEAYGGKITVENLRPICKPCNDRRGMATAHMFEYMLVENLPGKRRLDTEEYKNDPNVILAKMMILMTSFAIARLGQFELTKTQRSKIESKLGIKKSFDKRMAVISSIMTAPNKESLLAAF
jgi:hypothetical protein